MKKIPAHLFVYCFHLSEKEPYKYTPTYCFLINDYSTNISYTTCHVVFSFEDINECICT